MTNNDKLEYTIFLSHPSDFSKEDRALFDKILNEWNNTHNKSNINFRFMDWTSIPPQVIFGSGQRIIDQRIQYVDAVIAVFKRYIGTPVDGAASGTISELENAVRMEKPAAIFVNKIQPEVLDEGLTSYLKNHGLYAAFTSEEELRNYLYLWLDERLKYIGRIDPGTYGFRDSYYSDNPIYNINKRIINYCLNPYFQKGGAGMTWVASGTNTKDLSVEVNNGLSANVVCSLIVENINEDWICIRTSGLVSGQIYINDLVSGKEHAILDPSRQHVDFYIPQDRYLQLVFQPNESTTLTCKYLGICSSHIFPFDGSTQPLVF